MINFSISTEGMDTLFEQLARFDPAAFDLRPLAVKIGEILQTDNMQARMLGVDHEGRDFAPLAESTLRRRQGIGPPLAPLEMSSRVVSGMEIDIWEPGGGQVTVVASWPSLPFLRFHVTGTTRMPSRDPVGVRPEAWAEIGDAVTAFVEGIMAHWG